MKIIVPIQPNSFNSFARLLQKVGNRADLVEIWLDKINNLDDFLKKFKQFKQQKKSQISFLAVCKTPEEKGSFSGSEEKKIKILQSFLASGGDFVDLDIQRNKKGNIQQIATSSLLLSFHDFEKSPNNLSLLFDKMSTFSPAIYKIAVTPSSQEDLHSFLKIAKKLSTKNKIIFTTMGPLGEKGRTLLSAFSWGDFFALDDSSKTANGQKILK
ncbi:type I 3-dehydroquinate dehydratase [Candidatus Gracilibacteria bacterium]|nr:type I 3-dehydroquinate dehydratase [Candidatus Gracilibacteria bacterium]